ncbi:MAG: hypothetical protein E3J56_13160 [Candidatus Aminicenantes bacterium]|nr:MAG: hypothetical protein E3J56_13160 [Candidatus Aminicenantes bacterium]
MKGRIKSRARVKVLLEISLPDTWGGDCLLSQVYKQAKDSAANIIVQKISASMKDIRVIGKAEVVAILVEE